MEPQQTQLETATYSQVTSAVAMWYQQHCQADDYSDSDDEGASRSTCKESRHCHGPSPEDDASASIDSFVMRRMQFSALEKWGQSNRASQAPTRDILLTSGATEVESDVEDEDDDYDTIATLNSSKKKPESNSPVLLERPLPLSMKSKSKSTGIKPLKKSTLRRIKSEDTAASCSSKKKKTLMRKVVSDVDKARFVPNSKILEDNSDRWEATTGSDCKKNRVAGLLQKKKNSRSLSPRLRSSSSSSTNTEVEKKGERDPKQRRKLARAVSDLGSKRTLSMGPGSAKDEATASKANSTFPATGSSSKNQTERKRMIQSRVSAVAASFPNLPDSSTGGGGGCRPSIADIRTMMQQCHPNHPELKDIYENNTSKRQQNSSKTNKKKKSISRCLSENDAPQGSGTMKASKSCHSRMISMASSFDGDDDKKKETNKESVATTRSSSSGSSSKRQGSDSPCPPPPPLPKATLRRGQSQGNSTATTTTATDDKSSKALLGSSKSCHNRMIRSSSSSSSPSTSKRKSRSSSPKKSSSSSRTASEGSSSSSRRRSRSSSPKKSSKHTTKDTLSLPPPDFRWEVFRQPDHKWSPPTTPQATAA